VLVVLPFFVRSTFTVHNVTIPIEFNNLEIVCIDVNMYDRDYRVICFCRPPGFDNDSYAYLCESVKCLQGLCSTDRLVVIMGDFNLPCADWSNYHCPNDSVYQVFLNFVNCYGFHQHVTQPTRGDNILDLILSMSSTFVSELTTSCPLSTANHNAILFRVNAPGNEPIPEQEFYYDFAHADYSKLNAYFLDIDWNYIFQFCSNVEQCWGACTNVVNTAVEIFVPSKQVIPRYTKTKATCYPQYIKNDEEKGCFMETVEDFQSCRAQNSI